MSAEPDPAQEFAGRVAEGWFPGEDALPNYAEERDELIRIITDELRAGGWHKSGPPEGVDMARATFT